MGRMKFDSHDIKSELGHTRSGSDDEEVRDQEIIQAPVIPEPLEVIPPWATGNAIDVDNPPDYEVLRKVFPPSAPLRRSKRQAGYNPYLSTNKKFRHKGEPSKPPSFVLSDYTSGDSSDEDFELVERKKTPSHPPVSDKSKPYVPSVLENAPAPGQDEISSDSEDISLDPSTVINFALDIARGMAYLHSEPNVVIHRDLKPRNVLLVNTNADHLKVGDFGLSKINRVQHAHDVYKMTGETGSYRYMAPEVFKNRKYDKKVDVFSFAMTLYEMLEGEPPLSCYKPYEAARYVAEGHMPLFRAKGFTPELRDLTEQCWAADMNKRPSFLEILKKLEKIKEILPSDHHWHIFAS